MIVRRVTIDQRERRTRARMEHAVVESIDCRGEGSSGVVGWMRRADVQRIDGLEMHQAVLCR